MMMILVLVGAVSCQKTEPADVEVENSIQEDELDAIVELEDAYESDIPEEETGPEPVIEDFTMFFTGDVMIQRCTGIYDNHGINRIISDYIEEIEVATPLTFARYLNTPQGVIYGYSAEPFDSLLSRFMTEASDNDTKGLRFCGGWGTQLSGFCSAIASGRNTAYATLGDMDTTNEEAEK